MKVLQVIDSLRMGGAEVLLAQMHMGFRERGIECEYYLLHAEQTPLERFLADQGAQIHISPVTNMRSPGHIWALRSHLRAVEYDVIHVHLFPAQLWAACATIPSRTHTLLVTTEHNTNNRRRRGWYRQVDRWMYSRYDRIASISSDTTQSLVSWLPEVRKKIIECPNGVDLEKFISAITPGKQSLFSLPQETPVIFCVGRLEPVKDHKTLLKAISLVPDVVLVLAGDGILSEELHALADELKIVSRVQFLGKRMDIPQLLKASDIYVQPSLWEGSSIAIIEAMAAGKPIIVSDTPSLALQIGDAGLQFPVGNAKELAQRITTLLGSAELRSRLEQSARRRAEKYHPRRRSYRATPP